MPRLRDEVVQMIRSLISLCHTMKPAPEVSHCTALHTVAAPAPAPAPAPTPVAHHSQLLLLYAAPCAGALREHEAVLL